MNFHTFSFQMYYKTPAEYKQLALALKIKNREIATYIIMFINTSLEF